LFQKAESARTTISPLAPARRSRGSSSCTKRSAPRPEPAEPFRRRACKISPLPARLAISGW
jgi:hypothetical protein